MTGNKVEKKEKTVKSENKTNHIPETNIGLVGHVDHGKTTLTQALTGKWTDIHSEEKKRGITIRLGYADIDIYKCGSSYSTQEKCGKSGKGEYIRTISFVDAPGHETLMTTVLSGASIMNGALLIIAANETCPQPQTREHLTALDIIGIKNIVVVQNKIDLVSEKQALENYKQIKNFLKGSVAENAPIIPVSAQREINIDVLLEAIEKEIPTPEKDSKKSPKMFIARSFDINKPGTPIMELNGGTIGGSLVEGTLSIGDTIEIKPGMKIGDKFEPLITKIIGLQKSHLDINIATPGGLLGVTTELDPSLTKSDMLSGNIVGLPGKLPPVVDTLKFKVHLLERVVGSKEDMKVEPVKANDILLVAVGVARTIAVTTSAKPDMIQVKLKVPICAEKGDKVAISKQVMNRWRLIGWGEVE